MVLSFFLKVRPSPSLSGLFGFKAQFFSSRARATLDLHSRQIIGCVHIFSEINFYQIFLLKLNKITLPENKCMYLVYFLYFFFLFLMFVRFLSRAISGQKPSQKAPRQKATES